MRVRFPWSPQKYCAPDPLLVVAYAVHRLWLNGGPGCSSFDGWVYEQGPFKLDFSRERNGVNLRDNPHAWNKVANMIFLDSPSRECHPHTPTRNVLDAACVQVMWHQFSH